MTVSVYSTIAVQRNSDDIASMTEDSGSVHVVREKATYFLPRPPCRGAASELGAFNFDLESYFITDRLALFTTCPSHCLLCTSRSLLFDLVLIMPLRPSSQRVLSFITTYSCSRQPGTSTRAFATLLPLDRQHVRYDPRKSPSLSGLGKRVREMLCRSSILLTTWTQRAFHASAVHAAQKDPYEVLGVKRDASPAEIKKVYFSVRLPHVKVALLCLADVRNYAILS